MSYKCTGGNIRVAATCGKLGDTVSHYLYFWETPPNLSVRIPSASTVVATLHCLATSIFWETLVSHYRYFWETPPNFSARIPRARAVAATL